MNHIFQISQNPEPGARLLLFRGDTLTFSLSMEPSSKGKAWVRTNIGHGDIYKWEIIEKINSKTPVLGRDWFDIPMKRKDTGCFEVTLALCEVGHFQGKCFFLDENDMEPTWPEGSNVIINVEPSDSCCANIIYNAFVRQFGKNKYPDRPIQTHHKNYIETLDKLGYTVIPPSGTFRDLIGDLDFIIGTLGCTFLQLLPVHPTPTTYGRMGRFGSPYASLSFTAIDPALTEFDPRATPLEQFIELVDEVHRRNAKIIIDFVINHTGWAARLHEMHPEWLVRDKDGRIQVPGAWGVKWEDLAKLDYTKKDLWKFIAEMFLLWCQRGVDGFRCDAGYMVPVPAWKFIVASVREQYPNTVFFLEGLGGKVSVTRDILNNGNFNWAYSELFQNYNRAQIENYLPGANEISQSDGIMVHFAETHDNNRLAQKSQTYAKLRTALCALCSTCGAFGFANGVEWFATEKINVHDAPSLNWDSDENQIDHLVQLTRILKSHPTFFDKTRLKMIQSGHGNQIVLLRHHLPTDKKLYIVANLDDENPGIGSWPINDKFNPEPHFSDLVTQKEITPSVSEGDYTVPLQPGEVLCLTPDKKEVKRIQKDIPQAFFPPWRAVLQNLKAKALDVFSYDRGVTDLGNFDPEEAAKKLYGNPVKFCQEMNLSSEEPRVTVWNWENDKNREVMVPPKYFLLVKLPFSFKARILNQDFVAGNETALPCKDGSYFALFSPLPVPKKQIVMALKIEAYSKKKCSHINAPLLILPFGENIRFSNVYNRNELLLEPFLFLDTNSRGGMLRSRISWEKPETRYDALFSANLNSQVPVNRHVMFTRFRTWIVFQDYSQEICLDCLDSFCIDECSRGFWRYKILTGQGEHIFFIIGMEMVTGSNAINILFFREPYKNDDNQLSDSKPIELIIRPDIEDRNFHETTKAYLGPEKHWPNSFKTDPDGFTFQPDPNRALKMSVLNGSFFMEPEWHYMVYRPLDAQRGLDPDSDLFSPGYFSVHLKGNTRTLLKANIPSQPDKKTSHKSTLTKKAASSAFSDKTEISMKEALILSMDHYIVERGSLKSIIAGYPWFLDWGRDAMIFVRGLIAAGNLEPARQIIKQFGQFENAGTIPNMIQGDNAKNRDTVDAPLWFFIACSDMVKADKNKSFLEETCGSRTIRQILNSIARSMIKGTNNGIIMDEESGLIFSPSHFTWMDTNHPAGSPREGYPIEIQALWNFALVFLSKIEPEESLWESLAKRCRQSIRDLFVLEEGYLADCLHTKPGNPASSAVRDDALRPNQLFAITFEAINDIGLCRKILTACETLLVPGAIRSLADQPIRHPIKIVHQNKVINDPYHPFIGKYEGDEDTKRKPAYHNGTAWTWPFPTFCEAWAKTYGPEGKTTALAFLGSSIRLLRKGCIRHIPEILDGHFPHDQKGCDAQAWGISELFRIIKYLSDQPKN